MISTVASGAAGGPAAIGGAAWMHGLPRLLKLLGGKRDTESLGPGSFPGYNPDGSPMDDGGDDPWKYANFSTQPQQGSGGGGVWDKIKDGLPNPWPGMGGGGQTQQTGGGGIGARALGALKGMAPQLIGAGTQLIGSKMASNQMNRGNEINQQNSDRNYQMAQEEKRRRDALIKMIMPQLAQGMQIRDPERVRQMVGG